jgi:multidrug efflux pump subunit AcrA (membrane-fusion protein)
MALRTIPRHDPPARSAERQALAAAIETAAEAERSLDAARRAAARANDFVEKARIRLVASREAVAERREAHVQGLAEAARTGSPAVPPSAVREASRAVVEAEAEVEMAESAAGELCSRVFAA